MFSNERADDRSIMLLATPLDEIIYGAERNLVCIYLVNGEM